MNKTEAQAFFLQLGLSQLDKPVKLVYPKATLSLNFQIDPVNPTAIKSLPDEAALIFKVSLTSKQSVALANILTTQVSPENQLLIVLHKQQIQFKKNPSHMSGIVKIQFEELTNVRYVAAALNFLARAHRRMCAGLYEKNPGNLFVDKIGSTWLSVHRLQMDAMREIAQHGEEALEMYSDFLGNLCTFKDAQAVKDEQESGMLADTPLEESLIYPNAHSKHAVLDDEKLKEILRSYLIEADAPDIPAAQELLLQTQRLQSRVCVSELTGALSEAIETMLGAAVSQIQQFGQLGLDQTPRDILEQLLGATLEASAEEGLEQLLESLGSLWSSGPGPCPGLGPGPGLGLGDAPGPDPGNGPAPCPGPGPGPGPQ